MKNPQPQTRSELLINLNAAANSKNPITTLIEFSQPPLFGNLDKYCGNSAKKKKGNAKAVEKLSIPIIGQKYAPVVAIANKAPTNATVHVKEVRVNVNDINMIPNLPPFDSLFKLYWVKKEGTCIS